MQIAGLGSAALWGAFLLGLTGGFGHCLAMCGPFVAAASLAEGCGVRTAGGGAGSKRPLGFQLGYHGGRLTTYALLGALLGLLGQAGAMAALTGPFSPDNVTRWLKLAGGVAMVAAGVVLLASSLRARGTRLPEPTRLLTDRPWFAKTTAELLRRGPRWGFALGMLMGLLPCAPLLPGRDRGTRDGLPALRSAHDARLRVGHRACAGWFWRRERPAGSARPRRVRDRLGCSGRRSSG